MGNRKSVQNITDFTHFILSYHYPDFQKHAQRVKLLTALFCEKYNKMAERRSDLDLQKIPEESIAVILEGAALHDIGLVSVPDSLLKKKGTLSEEEKEIYRDHCVTGAKVIDRMAGIYQIPEEETAILRNIVLHHHERVDGSGYPDGLKGAEIPVYVQLVSIAEVYDALVSDNYSAIRKHEEALQMIMDGKCGAFDPVLLNCVSEASRDIQVISECENNDERMALVQNTFGGNRRQYWKMKRTLDLLVCIPAVVVLSPLFLLLSAVIYIDDPHGSPFFLQTRVGRHGKLFKMYKFRSMYVDAEERKKELEALNEKDGPVFKIANDPRITRVGHFIRKTSLDELPQLFNIIKGDMTLVGPRPPLPAEVQQYSRYTEMRLSVTPGLTCIWQSNSDRDSISFDKWMDMDITYIGTRSLWGDFKLLLKTVGVVLNKGGH